MGVPECLPGESAESVGMKGFGETAEPGGSEGTVGSDVSGRSAPFLSILNASTVNSLESVPNLSILNASTKDLEASAMSQEREISLVNEDHSEFSIPVTVDSAAVDQVILDGVYGLSISIMADESGESSPDEDISGQTPAAAVRSCESKRSSTNMGISEGTAKASSYDPYKDFHRTLQLRGYQQEVAQSLLRDENGVVVLPTGTGKTYVAIHIILNHIEKRRSESKRSKIIFLVPTATLATQQLEKIKDYMSLADSEGEMCMKITGEDNTPLERVKELIKNDEQKVLVVTPAIVNNYFVGSDEASITDFTLLIFDECHHAKKDHQYNLLLQRYYQASKGMSSEQLSQLPQLMGMTASLGVGDATNDRTAFDFMLSMCARFNLSIAPVAVKEHLAELEEAVNNPHERIIPVESREKDPFTHYLETKIMSKLEASICDKVQKLRMTEQASLLKQFKFPTDRSSQAYQQFVIVKESDMSEYMVHDALQADANYIILGLRHLLEYYWSLKFVSLLQCKHGVAYLESMLLKPEYQGIEEIVDLLKGNMDNLRSLQKAMDEGEENEAGVNSGNPKLNKLHWTLKELFSKNPGSKVIIFVEMRTVAKYMAEWLCSLDPENYRATEFISTGPSTREGGMKPSDLVDAREGFEGDKYNILVSTSVLEEGIDIQACNMVIKYMYSKDMIAKIQTRGRVRHREGHIVIFADFKLLKQEQRNNFKEDLMWRALVKIQSLKSEDFVAQVARKKDSKDLFPPKTAFPKRPLLKTGKVRCRLCGSDLGKLQDIKCYLNGHHLVLDSSISEKVIPFPKKFKKMPELDGMVPHSLLLCSAENENGTVCSNQVGNLIKMQHTGCFFGMWNIKEIQVDTRKFKKYQEMKDVYEVENISMEKLHHLAPSQSFPPDQLQD